MTTSPTATSVVSLALIETPSAGAAVCTVTDSLAVPVTSLVPPGEDPVTVTSLTICACAAVDAEAARARTIAVAALLMRMVLIMVRPCLKCGADGWFKFSRIGASVMGSAS